MAFLFAADAGVFVAAAAGNAGPTVGTVAHPAPWITTVAAGTHNRDGEGSVTLGSGATFNGAVAGNAVASRPFIDSTAAGLPGADADGGRPVLLGVRGQQRCARARSSEGGRQDRPLRSRHQRACRQEPGRAEAGGAGMVLVNVTPKTLNADFHFVPTVHLADTARAALKAYAATAGATATINQATIVYNVPAPLTAAFSSRGPLIAGGGDLLKPDVIAPGQDIVAAVAPPATPACSTTSTAGRRCRARTWRDSPRCCAICIPTGAR